MQTQLYAVLVYLKSNLEPFVLGIAVGKLLPYFIDGVFNWLFKGESMINRDKSPLLKYLRQLNIDIVVTVFVGVLMIASIYWMLTDAKTHIPALTILLIVAEFFALYALAVDLFRRRQVKRQIESLGRYDDASNP